MVVEIVPCVSLFVRAKGRKQCETSDLDGPYATVGWHGEDEMVMLIQVMAGILLVVGSGLIFHALFEMERSPRPVARPMARRASTDRELPRAA